ncbi:hypothetical protein [Lacticaseibacillus rhamnosus]|jgi:molecular chaperone GrpE (heat shock protein)|uniref:hypothetical protein n=1 Tax=Lacticaseibacillus rhamnosus TaxID=47715 RepID=UPI00177C64B9|nr:hypothetical protein [Lacticaseibacillus rhamnosus]
MEENGEFFYKVIVVACETLRREAEEKERHLHKIAYEKFLKSIPKMLDIFFESAILFL